MHAKFAYITKKAVSLQHEYKRVYKYYTNNSSNNTCKISIYTSNNKNNTIIHI